MSENNSSIMTIADFNIKSITEDTMSALDIHNSIISAEQTAAAAMLSLCENLKKMRDTALYKSLGFVSFEEYTEQACNIKKRQAYNYIQTYEKLGSGFLQSNAQLGITKLQLLTEVCAVDRYEFVEDNDLENMSVSEIKELVRQNNQRGEQLTFFEEKVSTAEQDISEKDKIISELKKQNEELRNRPIEVAVQEPSAEEIEKAVEKKTKALKAEFAEKEKQLKADAEAKIKKEKDKAKTTAEKDKQKAIDEAVAKAQEEAKEKYKEQIAAAEAEKAEALKKAEELALKLDKNANADLVTASIYFTEVQKQLSSFKSAAEKITTANPEQGAKLKTLAINFLSEFMSSIS